MSSENQPSPTWYKEIWSLDARYLPWVKDTEGELDFVIDALGLSGSEKILDLACGFGRHAIELSRRGFSVVGVDITPEYIREAERTADLEGLNTRFICSDIRDISINEEYDVVLNMADGAIGYLEDDDENLKIFDLIASSLKKGGKHFMHIINAEYAELHFPERSWEVNEVMISLPEFCWDKEDRRLLYGEWQIKFGEIAKKPETMNVKALSTIRLYSVQEIEEIFASRKMVIRETFGKFDRTIPSSHWELDLLVYSEKL